MNEFVELTHYQSGEKVFLRASEIHTVRQGFDRTLVICRNNGMYVKESAHEVFEQIEIVEGFING